MDVLAQTIEMKKEFLCNGLSDRFKNGRAHIYCVRMAAMALAERGTQITGTVWMFFTEPVHSDHWPVIISTLHIAAWHYVQCQKVKG
tara:strand:- start:8916 stop:9176 length:261 start_codon:yes stop_codon:yes gene_type:complete